MAAAAVLAPQYDVQGMISAEPVRLPADKIAALITGDIHVAKEPAFDASCHLAYTAPQKRYTMSELGLDPKATNNRNKAPAVIDFAMSEPFPLLSEEGVKAMRAAVLSQKVLENCPFKVKDAAGEDYTHWELRNTTKHSAFIRDFWKCKAVNDAVSDALQYPVIPTMDVELGHVNLQTPVMQATEGVTGWHTDENCQFVCILMLSDATTMVGGETAFRRADGSVALIKYPAAGYAIVMQGLNILHSVTNVISAEGERMSMVTSYQPADHREPQNGMIKSLHPLGTAADTKQMCAEYSSWRLNVMSTRLADLAAEIEKERMEGGFSFSKLEKQAAELSSFLKVTVDECDPAIPC